MQLNKSKDGYLTVDEICAGAQDILEDFRSSLGKGEHFQPDWKKVVTCIDVDQDGVVGFDEFVSAATDRYKLIIGENHLQQVFAILDKDKDGAISN